MGRVQYAGLELNWVCVLVPHSCCAPKGMNSLLGDRITVQPVLFQEYLNPMGDPIK